MTENNDEEAQDFHGKASVYENGHLDIKLFIDTSPAFQRLANNVVRIFNAKVLPHNFAGVLQHLRNCFGYNGIYKA
jgi:hypothetical protein